jgi:predicted nucleotidyltransferase
MNPLLSKIRDYFKNHNEVVAVYIFGSFATGKERIHSDIDLAVLIDSEKAIDFTSLQSDYYADLSRITRMDIDLVIMNKAGEGLLKQIYQRGRLLFVRDDAKLSVFNMISYSRIADFGYHYTKMRARVIKSVAEE